MLAILGVVFVAAVFIFGVVVVTVTLAGARRRKEPLFEVRPDTLPPKQSGALLRQVADSEIEREIRSGRVLNAIRLYQEQTGATVKDARAAVEAWKERLSAS